MRSLNKRLEGKLGSWNPASELDQHVLSNHSFGSHNVNATYISQHFDHLATCAEKIDAGITRRIQGTHPVKRKAKRLRAVR